jgi:hypothetical protein
LALVRRAITKCSVLLSGPKSGPGTSAALRSESGPVRPFVFPESVPTFLQPHTQHFSLHNYFGTRPFTALARALQVMRPAAFADRRACTRVLCSATSSEAIASTVGRTLAAKRLVVQKSSKSANVRCTVISRVSTASRPASVHKSRRTSIRDAPELGGRRGVRPIASISAWIGS